MTNLEITKAYVGDTQVEKIYLGTDVVYEAAPPVPVYSAMPLTFEIISGGTITWKAANSNVLKTISYSKDNGSNWTDIISTTEGTSFSVAAGDKVLFKGENTRYATNGKRYNGFSGSTAVYNVYGNIMSLVSGDNFSSLTTLENIYIFYSLFQATKVNDASNLILPATALTQSCYEGMFSGCTSLTTAPELPATTLAVGCYAGMFAGCTSLTTAPELPATTLAASCYASMFRGCTNLTHAPSILPATTLAPYCYNIMFMDTSIAIAPELPAETLAGDCYGSMLRNCRNLTYIKCLAIDKSARDCLNFWTYGVSPTGTFVKHPNTTWTTGEHGIPTGWTVEDADI